MKKQSLIYMSRKIRYIYGNNTTTLDGYCFGYQFLQH